MVVVQRDRHVRHERRIRRRASFLEVAAHRHVDRRQHHVVDLGPAALGDLPGGRKRQSAVRENPVGARRCLQHVRRVDERRGKPAADAEPPQPLVPCQAGHVVRDAARFAGDAQQRRGRGRRARVMSFGRRNRQHPLPDRVDVLPGGRARDDAREYADEADAVDEPVVGLEVERHAAVGQAREDVHLPEQLVARQQLHVDAADVPEQRPETAATGQRVPVHLGTCVGALVHLQCDQGPHEARFQPIIEGRPHRAFEHARNQPVGEPAARRPRRRPQHQQRADVHRPLWRFEQEESLVHWGQSRHEKILRRVRRACISELASCAAATASGATDD
jgi:hypothetical protein